jgi:hypothetical protein
VHYCTFSWPLKGTRMAPFNEYGFAHVDQTFEMFWQEISTAKKFPWPGNRFYVLHFHRAAAKKGS